MALRDLPKIAGKELLSDATKAFRPGNLKEKVINKVFEGDDIFARVGRKAFGGGGKKKEKEDKKKVQKVTDELAEVQSVLQKVLINTAVLPDMAKDVSVIAQNMQQLVELNKPSADDFFRQEDAEESALEAGDTSPTVIKTEGADTGGEKKKGLMGKFLDMAKSFGGAIKVAFKKLFSFKNILKVFSKVFVPLTIIASLFNGIKDGFERYQETGKLGDAIFAGLGGVLKFLTFGVFGEDTVRNIFDKLGNLFEPISKSIQKVFGGIKSFFFGLFGGKDAKAGGADVVKPNLLDPPAGIDKEPPVTDPDQKKLQDAVKEGKPPEEVKKVKSETQDVITPEKDVKVIKEVSKSTEPKKKTAPTKVPSEEPKEQNPFASTSASKTDNLIAYYESETGKKRGEGRRFTTDDNELIAPLQDLDGQDRIDALAEMGLDSQGRKISAEPVNKGSKSSFSKMVARSKAKQKGTVSAGGDNGGSSLENIKPKAMNVPSSPRSNGSEISEKSSNIAESQRMEGSTNGGDVNNTNNTNVKNDSSTGSRSYGAPDVVDQEMLSYQ